MNENNMNEKLISLAQKGANRPIDKEFEDRISTLEEEVAKKEPTDAKAERIAMKLAVKIADVQKGDPGIDGVDGRDGIDGKDGATGQNGPPGASGMDGRDGKDGRDGRDGKDGQNGIDGKDGSPDTPDQVVEKVNTSNLLIKKERVEGLLDAIARSVANGAASVGITTTNFFKNGALIGRAKNINFIPGSSVTQTITIQGDTANVTTNSSGGVGGGQVNAVVAGTGISVDSSDAANPIVSSSVNYAGNETPSGTVNGSNAAFTLAHVPASNSLCLYLNGARQQVTGDYTLASATITFNTAPPTGSIIIADYRY